MHTYECTHTHTHILKYITCSVSIMLLVYMFSGLTVHYWITKWCALRREDYFSHSQHCVGLNSCGCFFFSFTWYVYRRQCCLAEFLVVMSVSLYRYRLITKKYFSQCKHLILCLLQYLQPFFWNVPRTLSLGLYPLILGSTTLYFDWSINMAP